MPAIATRIIPITAANTCFCDAVLKSAACLGINASRMANSPRLNAQLPNTSLTAKSADCTIADELMPTINSGNDVTVDKRIRPIHALPNTER